ncbi:PaaI family thioesterase [Phenylobacterium sp.]|uniref:PaaI family thioesterase n=1 Tax=Phenylobacterium sp. TaxID=1871053 RepID=UPI002733E5B1|nr:PaaI family thioesterase [Phenylobacterium sp.]MDP3658753.1 PaaI family thioesterase [Phenylobacterium sp.]
MSDGEDQRPAPPAGFLEAPNRGPFMLHNGPMFQNLEDPVAPKQAFFALQRHANTMGLVHGGMLSAFMDTVLAQAVQKVTLRAGVTVHLSVDYLDAARPDHWVIGEGRVTRETRDVVFAEGDAWCGGRHVARATGLFKMMRRRPLDDAVTP